jgi:hypothetical protein
MKERQIPAVIFINDARHMTIIWVLTELTAHKFNSTEEVKSKVNWVGHIHKCICYMSRKFYWLKMKTKEKKTTWE